MTAPRIMHFDQDYVEQSWSKEDGLPDNRVQAILQDHVGYIWVATQYGIARFDGARFVVFNHSNTPEMKSDNCLALAEDSAGAVWVATAEGLLRHYRGATRMQLRWPKVATDPFVSLCACRSGGVWVGTDQGLDFLQDEKRKHFDESSGLVSRKVTAVFEDNSGLLWVGTDKGLENLDAQRGFFAQWPLSHDGAGSNVVSIVGRGEGDLWVLYQYPRLPDHGELFHLVNGQWEDGWTNRLGNKGRRYSLAAGRDGDWMACLWDHFGWMRYRGGQLRAFASFGELDFVPSCCLNDREGNVWVGTELNGLHFLTPSRVQTLTANPAPGHNNVRALVEASDESIWICDDQELAHYREGVISDLTRRNGLPRGSLRTVAEDRWGHVWVGSDGGGLGVLLGDQIFNVQLPGNNLDNKIRTIYVSKEGKLWIGTLRTVHCLALRSDFLDGCKSEVPLAAASLGELTTFHGLGGFKETDVRALFQDARGVLWAGTAGQGLYRIEGDHWERMGGTNQPSSDFVWAFCEDRAGTLWMGTDRGINRFQNGRFDAITVAQGLPDNLVNSLIADDRGNLWVGHDHGIYRVSIQDLNDVAAGKSPRVECVSYDEGDGLRSLETNGQTSQPPVCKSHDGRLWFPTTHGVAIVDPMNPPDLTHPPSVVIEQVRANGRGIFGCDANKQTVSQKAATNPIAGITKVLLPAGSARILELEYTAISFNEPQKVHFKYRLDGLDKEWIDAGSSRKAYYANLPPGDYRFRVIAANKHLVWNEVGASFAFHYAPFFYQTTSFYVVTAACLIGLGFALYRWRMSEVRKMHHLQAETALLRERGRIGKDLHDGLGANLTQLSLLADEVNAESNGADAADLRKVSESARNAVHALREIIWAADPGDETCEGLVARVCQVGEELLKPARIRCLLDLPPELPQCRLTTEERQNLLFVAKEAVNNAIKHSRASEVRIQVTVARNSLNLVIADDGCGFAPQQIDSSGHGLANMQHRLDHIGGQFELESHADSGTTIRIRLGLKDD